MRNSVIPAIILGLFLSACEKDKFDTRPTLKLKSVSTREVVPATPVDLTPNLILSFEFTDKEGDLAGARIGVIKEVSNCEIGGFMDLETYKFSSDLPKTTNLKGVIDLNFPYFKINPICPTYPVNQFQGDSAVFYVWVEDNAGNVSDTVSTGLIRIRR